MLFNWDIFSVCVIFEWWKIDSLWGMFMTMLLIVFFSMMYERLRLLGRTYDLALAETALKKVAQREEEGGVRTIRFTHSQQMFRSLLYALQVFLAFMLMLVFMTYNGFLMIAVVVGSALGFYFFGNDLPVEKSSACH